MNLRKGKPGNGRVTGVLVASQKVTSVCVFTGNESIFKSTCLLEKVVGASLLLG